MQRDENKIKPTKQNKTKKHQNRTQWQHALEGVLLVMVEHTCISTSCLQGRQLQGAPHTQGSATSRNKQYLHQNFYDSFLIKTGVTI